MPDFAGSKTQRVNKYAWLRAPQTPPPGLQPGLHRKTTFCFSARKTVTPDIRASRQAPFRLDRLARFRSHSFPLHAKKNRGKPAKPIPLYFNYNSNPSISFAISFTALLAVQSVYSSAQATQWSYMNATRSPVSLILALISAIFSSSSFFNSF